MSRRVVGYARVGTRESVGDRPEIAEQLDAIRRACEQRGWEVVATHNDVRTGRTLRRPGLQKALAACASGKADAIVVARLDRLTYAIDDLAQLVRDAVAANFAIVCLEPDVDLGSDAGRAVGEVLAAAAEWMPRDIGGRVRQIARRGRDAMMEDLPAVRPPGRPPSTPEEVAERIRGLRADGMTLQAICDLLNDEGVPTPRGGKLWRPTSLRSVLRPSALLPRLPQETPDRKA
jgi:DNA invertase Pin-like site-specific DNA recombinase